MKHGSVLLFVDAVEDEDAWILIGDARHRVARAILPPGAGEGAWLRLSIDDPPPEVRDLQGRRAQLMQGDPGGKIKL